MNYGEWEEEAPEVLTGDPLWTVTAYRLAVFLGDVAWHDVTKLCKDRAHLGLAGQLYEAAGSISANIAEGYSRGGQQGSSTVLRVRSWVSPRKPRLVLTRAATYWARKWSSTAWR